MTTKQFVEKAIEGGKRDYMRNPQYWWQRGDYWDIPIVSKVIGYTCMVSDEDVDKVRPYRWYLKDGYAVTSIQYKRVKMHHLIMGKPPKGLEIDHANRNRLDNRRENLRFLTRSQNAKNREAGKGIRQRGSKWEAYIQVDNKQKYLGMFENSAEARETYLQAKKEYHAIK